jgi:hypothetical protein
LCPPSTEFPICVFYKTYIQFYPETGVEDISMTYLMKPVEAVYAFDITNDREVYNDGASVDIEWREQDINKIIMRTLQILGINLSDAELTNFAIQKSNE